MNKNIENGELCIQESDLKYLFFYFLYILPSQNVFEFIKQQLVYNKYTVNSPILISLSNKNKVKNN